MNGTDQERPLRGHHQHRLPNSGVRQPGGRPGPVEEGGRLVAAAFMGWRVRGRWRRLRRGPGRAGRGRRRAWSS